MFTKELIKRMNEKNITIIKVMIGITEYAKLDLEEDTELDLLSYNVCDTTPPTKEVYNILQDGETVYKDVAEGKVINYILTFLKDNK